MATNFNTGPYFDDFDPAKNFYRVLFKPGYAVQARELNQLQSILQHQVSSVGNHLFKKNSMVIPGGIALNTSADIVSVTNIADPSVLVGKTITNATSFDPTDDSTLDDYITAVVLGFQAATTTTPAALYVKYYKTQADGRSTFNQAEELRTVDVAINVFNVDSTIGSTIGKVATLNAGTFFTKEVFVDAAQQSIIVETNNATTTNCIIGLNIVESIVTSDQDESLLDNANGSPNQYAPGADRYKIDLVLTRLDRSVVIDDEKFIRMMEVENNVITYLNNKTEYAELMKTLARRTYDANGNFIVSGLDTSVTEAPDDNYIWVNIGRGKCYLGGYEYEQITDTPIAIEKPRTSANQLQVPEVAKYSSGMAYFYIAGGSYIKEIPQPDSLVQFLDAAPGTSGASVIGYGIFKDIQFAFGTTDDDDVYKVFFDYIALEKGYTTQDIGGFKSPVANEGSPILHELRLGNIIGTFTPGNDLVPATGSSSDTGLIYTVVNTYAYVIKDSLNSIPSSETVKDATTDATATLRTSFVTTYDPAFVPMIELDSATVKTLYTTENDEEINKTSYSVIQRDVFNVTTAGTYTLVDALGTYDTFEEYSTSDYFAFISDSGSEQFVDLTNILTITDAGKRYELEVPEGSPMLNNTVVVYSTVNKTRVAEAGKVLTTVTPIYQIPTPSHSWMALGHQDVVRLIKVVDGKVITISNATWATDVATITASYQIAEGGSKYQFTTGSKVVVKNVASSNNTGATYYSGYNGEFIVVSKSEAESTADGITTVTVTFTYALTSNPGTYSASDAVVALAPDITNDTDITSRFILESGNTPYISGTGLIKLKKGATLPQGQIGVQYTYYVMQDGNYVSVDSYGSYTSSDLSYIGDIANVMDYQKRPLEVRRYIDFRTRPSHYFFKNIGTIASGTNKLILRDLNLSGRCACLEGKYVVGPSHLSGATVAVGGVKYNPATGNSEITLSTNASETLTGIYYIGLNGSGLSIIDAAAGAKSYKFPKDNTRLTYQYVKFTPKQVMVYVDRQQDLLSIKYDEINSLVDAAVLRRNPYKLPLTYLNMDPYTVSIQDVDVLKFENPVYQMLDIHELKVKIDRNEYYASLALNRDVGQEAILAGQETLTTSSRGFWNEDFMDLTVQDFENDDFACTIYDKSYAAPGTVTRTINLQLDTSLNTSTWRRTGSTLSLPYTESRAFGNDRASRSNNLNPYNTIQWNGKLKLVPSVDNWIDVTSTITSTVNNTITNSVTDPVVQTPAPVVQVPVTPPVVTEPPVVLPRPPVDEIVTEITNLRVKWGRDSAGGYHGITFDWKTNLGRTGRVNTDMHLSKVIRDRGFDGTYAKSLINKRYNDVGVKEYLNAGAHFDQKPPSRWLINRVLL